LLDE
jgi:hypothetical protein